MVKDEKAGSGIRKGLLKAFLASLYPHLTEDKQIFFQQVLTVLCSRNTTDNQSLDDRRGSQLREELGRTENVYNVFLITQFNESSRI